MDAADIFAQFFGDNMFSFAPGGGRPGRRHGKGDDSVIPYEVTLEDLYNGKTVKMNMEKEAVCGQCKGYIFVSTINITPLKNIRLGLGLAVMPNLNHVCHVKARGGLLFNLKFAFVSVYRLYTNDFYQISPSRIGTSRMTCHSCAGSGEKLKEKDR